MTGSSSPSQQSTVVWRIGDSLEATQFKFKFFISYGIQSIIDYVSASLQSSKMSPDCLYSTQLHVYGSPIVD